MKEKWMQLYDWKDYQISNLGVIRSVDRTLEDSIGRTRFMKGKILNSRFSKENPHHFSSVQVTIDGVKMNKTVYLHRAVADHFIPKPSDKHNYASHIVKDYSNNTTSNIVWITHKELMSRQPKRLEDPTKSWRTRREIYGNTYGSASVPKWNPTKQWETKRKSPKFIINKMMNSLKKKSK